MPEDLRKRRPRTRNKPFAILVVDDEPDVLESIKDVLMGEGEGVEVLTARSGASGLEILDSQPVDLILADYRMAPMNGLEFLVHARRRAPEVPRIMVTAYPDAKVAAAAINEGNVAGLFFKPIEPENLLTVVRNSVGQRAARADRARALAQAMDAYRRGRLRETS